MTITGQWLTVESNGTVLPQAAYQNIQALIQDDPQVYGPYGFYDSLDPTTGAVAHRYLDLDQGMILTALDNALDNGAMRHRYMSDPVGQVDSLYLRAEQMSVAPENG